MSIKTIPAAWKSNLRTGSLADRDFRLYIDPRQIEYPDLGTGSAQYTFAREDNLIDRGNCESATAPMIFGETVPVLTNTTFARSADFAHGGAYSYKVTKTIAAGTGALVSLDDAYAASTTDMHGLVAGETYEYSFWVYVPTASGIAVSEIDLICRNYKASTAAWSTVEDSDAPTALDTWQKISGEFTLDADATGFIIYLRIASTAANAEYFYIDDIRVTAHTVPGSHYLSSGYIETLCPMTETFTVQIKFRPTFAFDTGSIQYLCGWRTSATQYFRIYYAQSADKFYVEWYDGGTTRYIISAQYDNGASFRNINQLITLTAAIDLSTGTTAGSSLWMDKTQDDTTWGGNIDAKSTEFNKLQIRAYNGTAGAYDIAYVRLWPNRILTNAEVQNDAQDVAGEEIFWSLDGHGTGRTRVNINTTGHRVLEHYDSYKGINGKLIESYGANTFNIQLNNDNGEFSDDQNAAFDPANAVYNGTNAQNYLQGRFGVMAESWYGGDFDYVFNGRADESGFKRQSKMNTYSRVYCAAEDGVGDLDRYIEEYGRVFPGLMLARDDTLIDRGGCESTTNPCMYGETATTLSNATFARSAAQVYGGRYSYLATKTIAAGTAATITLADSVAAGDMHGLTAGNSYTLQAKVYISSGAMLGSELVFALVDSAGSTTQAAANTYDAWQWVTVARTLNAGATYAYPQLQIAAAAAINETFYIDEIKLIPGKLSEAHDLSLFHQIAKRGYRKQLQYLANNSFENATIGNSWLVTAGGALNRDAADGFIGSCSGKLIPGAAAEQAYQTVTFTGSRKLNVGETYTFWCFLKSTAAATGADNYIDIKENDVGGNNDSTAESYTLAGGEGYKLAYVPHTITDDESDRLQVTVSAAAGDTINIDAAMLCQGDRVIYYFETNTNDGASGIESADDADEILWPWFGIHTGNVDYIHPWRRMDKNTSVWVNLKSVGAGTGALYCGFDESGTLINEAILDMDHADKVPMDTVTDVGTDVNHILHDGLTVTLDAAQANCLYGSGDRYEVSTQERLIYLGSASGAFEDTTGNNQISETVANGAYFPDPDTYGEFWAQYGAAGKNLIQSNLTVFPAGYLRNGELSLPPEFSDNRTMSWDRTLTATAYWTNLYNKSYSPVTSKSDKIVGVQNATLFHKTSASGGDDGELSYITSGTLVSGLDITSRGGEARILLLNETGDPVTVTEVAIVGLPIYQFTGDEGFIHDSFIDRDDIMKNGERLVSFGGGDVIASDQLNRMADYIRKDRSTRKHIYVCASYGALHDIGPNDNMWIDVGEAGYTEDLAGTMVATSIRISADADKHGHTEVTYRELTEAWKYDSSAIARFVARGVPIRSPSTGAVVTVGSEYCTVDTDYRVAIGDTSAEDVINAALNFVSNTLGSGIVQLVGPSFITDGAISIPANVTLDLGGATIIKNCNDYGIECVGGAGTEIVNAGLRNGVITRDAADTNDKALIYVSYADDFKIENVVLEDAYTSALYVGYCDRVFVNKIRVIGFGAAGALPVGVNIVTGGGVISDVIVDGENTARTTSLYGFAVSGEYELGNILVMNLNSNTYLWGIHISAVAAIINNLVVRDLTGTGSNPALGVSINSDADRSIINGIRADNIDNTNTPANSYGIFISAGVDDCTITGILATNCSGTGVYVDAATCDRNILVGRSTNNGTNLTDNGTNTNTAAFDST